MTLILCFHRSRSQSRRHDALCLVPLMTPHSKHLLWLICLRSSVKRDAPRCLVPQHDNHSAPSEQPLLLFFHPHRLSKGHVPLCSGLLDSKQITQDNRGPSKRDLILYFISEAYLLCMLASAQTRKQIKVIKFAPTLRRWRFKPRWQAVLILPLKNTV